MNNTTFFIRVMCSILLAALCMGILYTPYVYELYTTDKSITIAAWGDVFDPAILAAFQKKTGIKIAISYYSSNEELVVKLKKTGGKGFDLIIPSDYAVQQLREQHLLKKLDRSKLIFIADLNPVLLGHAFDPHNEYSLPWLWEVFGVGIDRDKVTQEQRSDPWQLIFNPLCTSTITMVNDPLEMVMLASLYLYGNTDILNAQQIAAIQTLLRAQRAHVKAYVDFRADYFLATRNCAAVVSSSSYILRAQKQFPHIMFLVPDKTFVTIENCALSVATQHEDEVYQLLNFLYQPENVLSHCQQFSLLPSTLSVVEMLEGGSQQKDLAQIDAVSFSRLLFFKKQIEQIDLIKVWAVVKS